MFRRAERQYLGNRGSDGIVGNSKFHQVQILVLVVLLIVLGTTAWGVGWVAHDLFSRRATPSPRPTSEPTSPPTLTVAVSITRPATSPVVVATSTSRPTVTPAPTFTPTPAEEWETVRQSQGLYQVCRRHCPEMWTESGVPSSLEEYARQVARINGLQWGNSGPSLQNGQRLLMPPCP